VNRSETFGQYFPNGAVMSQVSS